MEQMALDFPTVYHVQTIRLQVVREREVPFMADRICGPQKAARLARDFLGRPDREHLLEICLNAQNMPVAIHVVSVGELSQAPVHPREVFKAAILANSAGIILAHNHPSGDPLPSNSDIQATKRLVECGELLGVQVLDHIVLGEPDFTSMKDAGLI